MADQEPGTSEAVMEVVETGGETEEEARKRKREGLEAEAEGRGEAEEDKVSGQQEVQDEDAAAAKEGEGGDEGDGDGGDEEAEGEGAGGEMLKIMIYGFNKWDNHKSVSKWLAKNGIKYDKLKRIPHTNSAYLRFSTLAARDEAMEKVQASLYRGKTLFTTVSREDVGSQVRRGQHKQQDEGEGATDDVGGGGGGGGDYDGGEGGEGDEEGGGGRGGGRGQGKGRRNKRAKVEEGGAERKKKTLAEAVTPLLGKPYEEQLSQKQELIRSGCVEKLFRELKFNYKQRIRQRKQTGEGAFVYVPDYVKMGADSVHIEKIKPAPQVLAYRNKCEFTIGADTSGEVTVGFRVSNFEEGVNVESPAECVHLDDQTKAVAAAFQRFVRSSSLPVWDLVHSHGVWRLLTVRTSTRTNQCMLVLVVSVSGLEEGAWKAEEERLVRWVTASDEATAQQVEGEEKPAVPMTTDGEGAEAKKDATDDQEGSGSWLGVTSLFVQFFEGRSSPSANDPVRRVWGKPYLEEDLLGLRFRISPNAFFQTSTSAAEVLYSVVSDWCTATVTPKDCSKVDTPAEGGGGKEEGEKEEAAAAAASAAPEENGDEKAGKEPVAEDGAETKGEGEAAAVEAAVEKGEEADGAKPKEGGEKDENLVLLDVCCGTGTIGICCAAKTKARAVLGIEMNVGAVADAKVNAKVNHIDNAAFVCSKAEDVLVGGLVPGRFVPSEPDPTDVREMLKHAVSNSYPVLAIVDPPRDGLHNDCVKAIRNCHSIKRLIYVSCNPTGSLVRDGVLLCSAVSKKVLGEAFRPVCAVPVDMFPQTPHCECVMIFERT